MKKKYSVAVPIFVYVDVKAEDRDDAEAEADCMARKFMDAAVNQQKSIKNRISDWDFTGDSDDVQDAEPQIDWQCYFEGEEKQA